MYAGQFNLKLKGKMRVAKYLFQWLKQLIISLYH